VDVHVQQDTQEPIVRQLTHAPMEQMEIHVKIWELLLEQQELVAVVVLLDIQELIVKQLTPVQMEQMAMHVLILEQLLEQLEIVDVLA